MLFTRSLIRGSGKALSSVSLLIVCEKSIVSLFLWFSSLVTTTWARHGERLGSIMPSSSRFTSLSMKAESSCLYRRDLFTMGWQSVVRFAKGSGGSICSVLKTDKVGSKPT